MTENKIIEIPTLKELISQLEKQNSCIDIPTITDYNHPLISIKNKGGKDQFIVSGLRSGRYSLKPNLTNQKFLFRGQRGLHNPCYPSIFRQEKDSYIIENLKVDEFRILIRSHPLSMMFERGINLENNLPPFFFEMNYYGLAQHYEFKTAVLDFTSDINVAAFFATTKYDSDGKYTPILNEESIGEFMVHEIKPDTFGANKFTTIGLQIFPRSGQQKGFLYTSIKGHDINQNETVKRYPFKHSNDVSQHYFDKMKQGYELFPQDDLAPLASEILQSKEISLAAINDNFIFNQKANFKDILTLIEDNGFKINPFRKPTFELENLKDYYHNIKNGLWEDFCKQIFFAGEQGQKLSENLLKLPQNNSYKQYFDEKYFSKISLFNKFS